MKRALVLGLVVACGGVGGGAEPLRIAIEGPEVAFVGIKACFQAVRGGAAAQVTWDFNEGSAIVGARACMTWTTPGERAVVAVAVTRTARAQAVRGVRVVPPPMLPAPTASSPLAYDAAREELWVVNPDAASVAVLAVRPPPAYLEKVAEIAVGAAPRTLAIAGGTVAVACQDAGTLALVDVVRREVRAAVALGPGTRPYGVAADPRGGFVMVTLEDVGALAVVDVVAAREVARVGLGFDARGVAVNGAGAVLVTRWRAEPEGTALWLVDASAPAAPRLAATALLPVDLGGDSSRDNNGVLSFVNQVVFAPDGRTAVTPGLKANVVSGLFRNGTPLAPDTTARAALGVWTVEGAGALAPRGRAVPYDDLDFASAVAFSPEGGRLYVAYQGAELVAETDPFSAWSTVASIAGVGKAPQGLAVSPDGRYLYVQGFLSRAVRVYDVSDFTAEPLPLAEVTTLEAEPLAPEVLRGKQIFYASVDPRMSRQRYLSCASCHLDGEGDGLTWDFTQRGEGLRNTISLAGHAGAAPLHWSANFDEVQDFEKDIREGQGGTGFLEGALGDPLGLPLAGRSPELDALAAYVSSLRAFGVSPLRSDDDAWRASYARGEAIFAEAGCASCHRGPSFSDSAFGPDGAPVLHDVGTIGPGSGGRRGGPLPGLDTPTLRGLWRTAPYLHDGSARTLREVLRDRNPEDRHGRTSQLDEASLADLEAYLLSLDDAEPGTP